MTEPRLSESYWPADTSRPILNRSIGEALAEVAWEDGHREAIIEVVPASMTSPVGDTDTNRKWTYAQLFEDAKKCAQWLLTEFNTGDRICIWAPNVPEWVVLQYGAALSGIVLVTANPALKAAELEFVLEQSKSAALFYLEEFRGVDMGGVAKGLVKPGIKAISLNGWLSRVREATVGELPNIDPEHPAQIQYTSGTTGRPNGALLHHRGLVTNASYVAARAGLDHSILLSPMPLFHTAGSIMSVLGCLNSRSTLVLPLMFEPGTVLDAVAQYRADTVFGVPTMLLALIDAQGASARDLSSLHVALSGGAQVPPELHRRVKDALGLPLLTVFGQTELSPIVAMTSVNDADEERIHSVGRPLWNVEVRIADVNDNAVLPTGVEGEIQVRGYQTMIGYFDAPEHTRQTIKTDGWLKTGDLGKLDAAGYLRITGRLKDMIIRGGENIYPAEVEACLMQHPAVADVSVFGAPDDRWGEIVAAAVRLAPGATVRADELISYCKDKIAPHKAPSRWFACSGFPLTASGKIQKFRLRDSAVEGALDTLP
ncbi:AMP-binding protein [Tardiphaga sp. 285_C5_N1_2]|uniref:AMP-binding protein n=1 Tax=Tardiphaga sp. 285_C5_N1_2 TaxID=3240775 RepID=UPI003F8CD784